MTGESSQKTVQLKGALTRIIDRLKKIEEELDHPGLHENKIKKYEEQLDNIESNLDL
jgi:hypothetical protein